MPSSSNLVEINTSDEARRRRRARRSWLPADVSLRDQESDAGPSHHHSIIPQSSPSTSLDTSQRFSLEISDGLRTATEPQDKLKDALRRSASGKGPESDISGSGTARLRTLRSGYPQGRQLHNSPLGGVRNVLVGLESESDPSGVPEERARSIENKSSSKDADLRTSFQERFERLRLRLREAEDSRKTTAISVVVEERAQTDNARLGMRRATSLRDPRTKAQQPSKECPAASSSLASSVAESVTRTTSLRSRSGRSSVRSPNESENEPMLYQSSFSERRKQGEERSRSSNEIDVPPGKRVSPQDATPLGCARRVSNSANTSSSYEGQDTKLSPRILAGSANLETSHALASLQASLAKLGADHSNNSFTSSPRRLRGSEPAGQHKTATADVGKAHAGPTPLCMPASLQRSKSREQLTAATKKTSEALRHVQRLSQTEGGLDEAGNSPRKAAPPNVQSSSGSGRSAMSFLERARAARAMETRRGSEASNTESITLSTRTQAKPQRQQRPLTSPPDLLRRTSSDSDQEDKAAVEAQLTPESSPRKTPRHSEEAVRRRRSQHSATPTPVVEPKQREESLLPRVRSLRSRSSTPVSKTKESSQPSSNPIDYSRCLRGVAVLVDVRDANGNDDSARWIRALKSCGAKVASRCPSADSRRQLTHIVWKQGKPSTLAYFRGLPEGGKPWIVGVAWVQRCVEQGVQVAEEEQLVEVGRAAIWAQTAKKHVLVAASRSLSPGVDFRSSLDQVCSLLSTASSSNTGTGSLQDVLKSATQHLPESPSPLRQQVRLDVEHGTAE